MDDTTPEAEAAAAQIRILRGLSRERRLKLCLEMSEAARELSRCGIRDRHPEYSAAEVEWALRRMVLGDELFGAAWPEAPRLAP